jgi:hypothetical protein
MRRAHQMIVSGTVGGCGEEFLAPTVVGKGPGFAQQVADDMSEIDDRSAIAQHPWQLRHFLGLLQTTWFFLQVAADWMC